MPTGLSWWQMLQLTPKQLRKTPPLGREGEFSAALSGFTLPPS
jgi:hypothetical protein